MQNAASHSPRVETTTEKSSYNAAKLKPTPPPTTTMAPQPPLRPNSSSAELVQSPKKTSTKKVFDARSLDTIQKKSLNAIVNELKSVIRNDLCKRLMEQRSFQLVDEYYKNINVNSMVGTLSGTQQNHFKCEPHQQQQHHQQLQHHHLPSFKRNISVNNSNTKLLSSSVKRPTTPPSPPPPPTVNAPPPSQATPHSSNHNSPATPMHFTAILREAEQPPFSSPNYSSQRAGRAAPQYFRYPSGQMSEQEQQQKTQSQVKKYLF